LKKEDSEAAAREKSGRPAPLTAEEKKARQERILAERQKKKDSIAKARKRVKDSVNKARQRKRDSILAARKNKANNLPKPPEEDDNGEGGI